LPINNNTSYWNEILKIECYYSKYPHQKEILSYDASMKPLKSPHCNQSKHQNKKISTKTKVTVS